MVSLISSAISSSVSAAGYNNGQVRAVSRASQSPFSKVIFISLYSVLGE